MEPPASKDFDHHHDGSEQNHPSRVLLGGAAIRSVIVTLPVAGKMFWLHGENCGKCGDWVVFLTLVRIWSMPPPPLYLANPKLGDCRNGT
jgi:hypothetical protein